MSMTPTTSKRSTVTNTSQEINLSMQAGVPYRLTAIGCDLYFRVRATGGTAASAGDDSHLLADGDSIELAARGTATYVAVIRAGSVDGACTLSRLEPGTTS